MKSGSELLPYSLVTDEFVANWLIDESETHKECQVTGHCVHGYGEQAHKFMQPLTENEKFMRLIAGLVKEAIVPAIKENGVVAGITSGLVTGIVMGWKMAQRAVDIQAANEIAKVSATTQS